MVWVRYDDSFYDHHKVVGMDPDVALEAVGLHVLLTTWCGRNGTDGRVPRSVVNRFASGAPHPVENIVDNLLRVPPGHTHGLLEVIDGNGYQVHDFLDYNPSKVQAAHMRKTRSEAGKRGAQSRWGKGNDGKGHMAKRPASDLTSAQDTFADIAASMASAMKPADDAGSMAPAMKPATGLESEHGKTHGKSMANGMPRTPSIEIEDSGGKPPEAEPVDNPGPDPAGTDWREV